MRYILSLLLICALASAEQADDPKPVTGVQAKSGVVLGGASSTAKTTNDDSTVHKDKEKLDQDETQDGLPETFPPPKPKPAPPPKPKPAPPPGTVVTHTHQTPVQILEQKIRHANRDIAKCDKLLEEKDLPQKIITDAVNTRAALIKLKADYLVELAKLDKEAAEQDK